jgi:ElaA protein
VLTRISYRRFGFGKAIMTQAMARINAQFPQQEIRISAQEHLRAFYNEFGFFQVGEGYDEDEIPHVEMLTGVN